MTMVQAVAEVVCRCRHEVEWTAPVPRVRPCRDCSELTVVAVEAFLLSRGDIPVADWGGRPELVVR